MTLSRRSAKPPEYFTVRVDALAHDGRGIARLDGKAVLLHGALPGEDVRFQRTARHAGYDEGGVVEVSNPAPERVEPRCPHFGICGGCNLQYLAGGKQIAVKQAWLLDNLSRLGKVRPEQILEPLLGPLWGYRRRARLGVKDVPKKGRVLVGFRERASTYLADLRRCEILDPRLGGLLEELAQLVESLSIRQRLPQIEAAVGDAALALNFRVLAAPNDEDKARLAAFGQRHDIQIYLQSKGPETTALLWPEQGRLSYRLPAQNLELEFQPSHFIQINAAINQQMVEQAITLLDLQADETVLDLFCGLGNFTLAMARYVRLAVGVEGEQSLVHWAQRNAARNGIDNARFFAADLTAEATAQPWLRQGYDKVLLDPPRSGALAMMASVAALAPRRVVYVSCHPATLARDAGELVHRFGYKLLSAGVMDMFPHTAHVESIALFERQQTMP